MLRSCCPGPWYPGASDTSTWRPGPSFGAAAQTGCAHCGPPCDDHCPVEQSSCCLPAELLCSVFVHRPPAFPTPTTSQTCHHFVFLFMTRENVTSIQNSVLTYAVAYYLVAELKGAVHQVLGRLAHHSAHAISSVSSVHC